jgi:hypothetical protein
MVALLTLALGIGANAAIFSVVNGVVLQPLPYPRPDQLMYFDTESPGLENHPVSIPEYYEFRGLTQPFADVGAYTTTELNLTAGARARWR